MRKTWDAHFMNIAREVASMGTCARRQVGCVLIDDRKVILSTGFNGVPPKWEHCRDNPGHECGGAHAKSGTDLDSCLATHAEVNALLHCSDVVRAHTVYTTSSPCISCVKALLCTGALRIVFDELYPHSESGELWTRYSLLMPIRERLLTGHRTWEQICPDGSTHLIASSGLR